MAAASACPAPGRASARAEPPPSSSRASSSSTAKSTLALHLLEQRRAQAAELVAPGLDRVPMPGVAVEPDRPGPAVVVDQAHRRLAPAARDGPGASARRRSAASSRSWPSAKMSAVTSSSSPTTRLTASRPSSTCGSIRSMMMVRRVPSASSAGLAAGRRDEAAGRPSWSAGVLRSYSQGVIESSSSVRHHPTRSDSGARGPWGPSRCPMQPEPAPRGSLRTMTAARHPCTRDARVTPLLLLAAGCWPPAPVRRPPPSASRRLGQPIGDRRRVRRIADIIADHLDAGSAAHRAGSAAPGAGGGRALREPIGITVGR